MDSSGTEDHRGADRVSGWVDDPLEAVPQVVLEAAQAATARVVEGSTVDAELVRRVVNAVVIAVAPWLGRPDEIPWGFVSVQLGRGDMLGGLTVGPDLHPTPGAARAAGGRGPLSMRLLTHPIRLRRPRPGGLCR